MRFLKRNLKVHLKYFDSKKQICWKFSKYVVSVNKFYTEN